MRKFLSFASAVSLSLAGVFYPQRILAAPGELDLSFGTGGRVIAGEIGGFWDLALQSDGKIVVVGEDVIIRYNADGSPDNSFGFGNVFINLGAGVSVFANSVAVQRDGKVVVAAERSELQEGEPWNTELLRYNANGTIDTTFNGNGRISADGGGDSVAIQPDGKIVACGGDYTSAISRYNSNGSRDTSFNGTGRVVEPDSFAFAVAIQADGKIVVAGSRKANQTDFQFAVSRYDANGSHDASFGGDGTVISQLQDFSRGEAYEIALQPDGKILVKGIVFNLSRSVSVIIRYNADGSLDNTFGSGGVVYEPYTGASQFSGDIAVQLDGRIVTAHQLDDRFAVTRYKSNGALDTQFSGGTVTTTLSGFEHGANAVAIQPNGDIVAAGYIVGKPDLSGAVARFQGDRQAFSVSGRATTPAGQGVRNAIVVLTDALGVTRTATTSSFGVYSFENVPPGLNYTLTVRSRRYRFAPLTVQINGSLSAIDLVGLE
jgi:uncharacterized delta-60 repeat protein